MARHDGCSVDTDDISAGVLGLQVGWGVQIADAEATFREMDGYRLWIDVGGGRGAN
jgi:hypothetical protein